MACFPEAGIRNCKLCSFPQRRLRNLFSPGLDNSQGSARSLSVKDDISFFHVLFENFLIGISIPASYNQKTIRRYKPPETVIPMLFLGCLKFPPCLCSL